MFLIWVHMIQAHKAIAAERKARADPDLSELVAEAEAAADAIPSARDDFA